MPIIGSRADVYEGRADRTTGGLTKADIICRIMAGKKLYISQRVSTRMREVMKAKTKKPIIKSIIPTSDSSEKTKKNVRFNLEQNEIKQFRYDELDGQDIEQLQREMEEEDDQSSSEPREFTIQELDDKQLDSDINQLL